MEQRNELNIPSQDINAEGAVLSAMMMSSEAMVKAVHSLSSSDFYKSAHAIIFSALASLFKDGLDIDIILLLEYLKENNQLEKAGGTSYINDISDVVITDAHADSHIDIVLKTSLRRRMVTLSRSMESKCKENQSIGAVIESTEKMLFDIAKRNNQKKTPTMLDNVLVNLDEIEHRQSIDYFDSNVNFGYPKIDRMTMGMLPSDFIILGGRPSNGKTAFATSMMLNASVYNKIPGCVFSLEMTRQMLTYRMQSAHSRIPLEKLIKGTNLSKDEMELIAAASELIGDAPIYIDDTSGLTPIKMKTMAMSLMDEYKFEYILIDYLQLMRTEEKYPDMKMRITEISQSLKSIAKQLKMPVIALSQLSRGPEHRSDKRPKSSDLRETGALEQDADKILMVYLPSKNEEDSDEESGEIIITKNRNGPTGTVYMKFIREITLWESFPDSY